MAFQVKGNVVKYNNYYNSWPDNNIIITYAITLHTAEIVTTNSDEFVTIASMIPKEQFVYPGQTLDVKCTTRSSTILAWRSPEYIGSGHQLGFASINHPGMMWSNSQGSATAKLDDVNQTEPIIMQSTITITVLDSDKFTSFTIFCHNVDHDKSANITFHKSGKTAQYYVQ